MAQAVAVEGEKVVVAAVPAIRCGCNRCGDAADSMKCFCTDAVCVSEGGICRGHGDCEARRRWGAVQ